MLNQKHLDFLASTVLLGYGHAVLGEFIEGPEVSLVFNEELDGLLVAGLAGVVERGVVVDVFGLDVCAQLNEVLAGAYL